MKKTLLCSLIIILTTLFSCSDDSDPYSSNETKLYYPSQIGNYWEYEVWYIYPDREESLIYTDSIKIAKEMEINGKKYFCVNQKSAYTSSKWMEKYKLRDSNGYIVGENEVTYFSNINFKDTLSHLSYYFSDGRIISIARKMEKVDTRVVLPAGSFTNVLDFKGKLTEDNKEPRYTHQYFAKNVGIIFEREACVSEGEYIEHRLKSYRINGVEYPSK